MKQDQFLNMTPQTFAQQNMARASVFQNTQFPGLGVMKNWGEAEIRNYVANQVKMKGQQFSLETGTNLDQVVQISGSARFLLGLSIFTDPLQNDSQQNLPTEVTLAINNELAIQQIHSKFLSPDFMDDEYYRLPRPLSGQDNITMTFNGVLAAQNIYIIFYYL